MRTRSSQGKAPAREAIGGGAGAEGRAALRRRRAGLGLRLRASEPEAKHACARARMRTWSRPPFPRSPLPVPRSPLPFPQAPLSAPAVLRRQPEPVVGALAAAHGRAGPAAVVGLAHHGRGRAAHRLRTSLTAGSVGHQNQPVRSSTQVLRRVDAGESPDEISEWQGPPCSAQDSGLRKNRYFDWPPRYGALAKRVGA